MPGHLNYIKTKKKVSREAEKKFRPENKVRQETAHVLIILISD